jgi:hypothetical protein
MNEGGSPKPAGSSSEPPAADDPTVGRNEDSPVDPSIDIRNQIGFYGHLLNFEQAMLERMRTLASSQPEEFRATIERFDIQPMEAMIGEFRQRLTFWQQLDRSGKGLSVLWRG